MLLPIPTVSVCIAGRSSARFLGETVRSVLDQSFRDFELIVVGDGGTDVARSFGDRRVRVERAPVSPGADGRNLATQLSRAALIKVLDPRDLLHPRCLELQVDAIETDPGLAMVAARWHVVDDESRVLLPHRGLVGLTGLHTESEAGRAVLTEGGEALGRCSTVLFRKEAFHAAGRWQNEHPAVIDMEMWLRLLAHGDLLGLPEPLAAVRAGDEDVDGAEQRRAFLDELREEGTYPPRLGDRLAAPGALVRRLGRRLAASVTGVPRGAV